MLLDPAAPRRAINVRSVALGLAGVLFICAFTPYNDYALNNTFLIGNNLPLGVVMFLFLFTLLINGPLSKYVPNLALNSGEVTVAFSMMLVSCAIPSSGLMRGFPASLVAPFHLAAGDEEFMRRLESMHLPRWLFPRFAGAGPRQWANDPIVQGFIGRWTDETSPIPYAKWTVPIFAWSVFMFSLYGALLCMVVIVRKQWFENERLPFPLAQIQLALVDQPERGNWLSELMSKRSFWIAFFAVFLLHVWNGLSRYSPKHFAEIWVWYDFNKLMGNPPWIYADPKLKNAAVFFTVVGVTYFLSSSVAFSLWFFFIANNVYMMTKGSWTGDPENYGRMDEHLGGLLAFMISFLWVGRHHWKVVIAQAFRGARAGEPRERYLPYPAAFWGFAGCTGVMIGFLWLAGCTWPAAVVTVVLVLTGFLIITRIIAETGLVHGSIYISFVKPWVLIAYYAKSGAWLHPVPVKSFYLGAMVEVQHYDYREVMPVYATHAMKVADETIYGARKDSAVQAPRLNEEEHAPAPFSRGACTALPSRSAPSSARALLALMALSLVIGYFTSFYSMLWTEYHYAWTKDVPGKLVNDHGVQGLPEGKLQLYPESYDKSEYYYKHDPLSHMTFGFAFTGILAFLRLRYTWWPLHPIGFLMIGTYPGAHLWLSIFLGWLCKTILVKFGGSKMYTAAKPFFLGLIVGESAAAGFWMIMGIALSALGLPYRVVNIMPG